jgi:hypothetical protein
MNNSSTTHNSILENEKISPLPQNFLFFETSLLVGYHEPKEEEKGMKSGNALETRCAWKNSPLVPTLMGPCFKHTLLW